MQDLLSSMDSIVESLAASDTVADCLDWLNPRLAGLFVADDQDKSLEEDPVCLVSPKTFVYALLYTYTTILVSVFVYRMRRRSRLKRELKEARAQLKYLQEKLQEQRDDGDHHHKTEVRIFMDGAFDLMHYGHMNAFRLARSLGTHLIVGVNSDESITACKAPPLMNDEERMTMVSSCKFVDEVVPDCPYIMNREYLDWVMEKYKIDYVVHGDDPCIVDGKDVYAAAKALGKYRSIPRTEGVSTTDIVGRMLIMTKEHHLCLQDNHNTHVAKESKDVDDDNESMMRSTGEETQPEQPPQYSLGRQSKFLTTSRMLQLFSSGVKAPAPGMRVVYIDGSWDMFHPGHVSLLRAAKERGDFLIVGVHGDAVVNQMLGMNLPLMNLHERVLSVLGCRFVDDVLIDAPFEVTQEMVQSLRIDTVLETPDTGYGSRVHLSRFEEVQDLVESITHGSQFSLTNILQRIQANQNQFKARFERKMMAERQFYEQKHKSSKV